MNLALLETQVVALLLHVVRTGAFFAAVPLFGRQLDTAMLRLVLGLAIGAMMWSVGHGRVPMPRGLLELGLMAVREGFIGLALGFVIGLLTSMLVAAGEIIAVEMGFAMARAINPESGSDATVVSQFFQVLGFLLVLHFDVHHEALRVLEHTFEACPVGHPYEIVPIWEGIRTLVTGSIAAAVQYAFPVLAVMMLSSVGLVLLGRAVPSVNLMDFSFGARVLLALLSAAWFLGEGTPFLLEVFGRIIDGAAAMFGG